MFRIGSLLILLAPLFSWQAFALIDLEQEAQAFILESRKLEIPGFPKAFNPSITRWKGSLLLSFRSYDTKTVPINTLGFVWLDEELHPVGSPYLLNMGGKETRSIDPRLIVVKDDLYIVYNRVEYAEVRRVCVAKVFYDGLRFTVDSPECLLHYEGVKPLLPEKNWVPFVYKDKLLLAYSLLPHRILQPLLDGSGECETFTTSQGDLAWSWGELRGGTPALKNGGDYLAFFHSSKIIETVQSRRKAVQHYVMGAYTFAGHPPFSITRISPKPLVGKGFYEGELATTFGFKRIIFPGGCILDKKYVWFVYGKQDREAWVAKLDKKALLESLIPVHSTDIRE